MDCAHGNERDVMLIRKTFHMPLGGLIEAMYYVTVSAVCMRMSLPLLRSNAPNAQGSCA